MRFRIKKFPIFHIKKTFLQRVRFQIKFLTTRQILKQKFHNVSDFLSKFFFKSGFEQKCAFEKTRCDRIYPVKWTKFSFFGAFLKNMFLAQKIF